MILSKQQRLSKINRVIALVASFLLVSGQLSAYPQMCAMPDMKMRPMDSASIVTDAMHYSESVTGMSAIDHATEPGSSNPHENSNCEQICGYCISPNLPVSDQSGLITFYCDTGSVELYIPPTPPGFYQDLLRPPIPA